MKRIYSFFYSFWFGRKLRPKFEADKKRTFQWITNGKVPEKKQVEQYSRHQERVGPRGHGPRASSNMKKQRKGRSLGMAKRQGQRGLAPGPSSPSHAPARHHWKIYTKDRRWDETVFGLKLWQAACPIVPTTQDFLTQAARHYFTPNPVLYHLPSFVLCWKTERISILFLEHSIFFFIRCILKERHSRIKMTLLNREKMKQN